MTWVLIIALSVSITGFQTREACVAAGEQQRWLYSCTQVPADGQVISTIKR